MGSRRKWILLLALTGCSTRSSALPPGVGYGTDPRLPAPEISTLPVVEIAPARGWPAGVLPRAAAGLIVTEFSLDRRGGLLVADDVGNRVWRVTGAGSSSPQSAPVR